MNEKTPRRFELPRDLAADAEFIALTDSEKQEILDLARKRVEEEQKKQERERLIDAAVRYERRRYLPQEQLVDILIDLPGHAPRLLIDGVPLSHARSMWEQMQRCWSHEHEIGGANRNFYRSPRNITIGPQHANVSSSRLLGL